MKKSLHLFVPIFLLITSLAFFKFSKIQLLFLFNPTAFLPGVFYYFIICFPLIITPKKINNAFKLN